MRTQKSYKKTKLKIVTNMKTIKITIITIIGMCLGVKAQHNYDNKNVIFSKGVNVGINVDNPQTPLHSVGRYMMMQLRLERTGNYRGFTDLGGANGNFRVWAGGYLKGNKFVVKASNGNVGIGTLNPTAKLSVNGKIHTKEVRVDLNLSDWADFVFKENYNLPTLKEVENHIKEKGHLKDIPSAKEVQKKGIYLGYMNAKLLQKIEELTLYTIEQEKKIIALEKENAKNRKQQKEIEELKKQNSEIRNLVQKLLKNKR